MADELDHAAEIEQAALQRNLAAHAAQAARAPKLAPRGMCRNVQCCEEFPPGDNRLFCDSRCAQVHERHNRKLYA